MDTFLVTQAPGRQHLKLSIAILKLLGKIVGDMSLLMFTLEFINELNTGFMESIFVLAERGVLTQASGTAWKASPDPHRRARGIQKVRRHIS